MEGRDRRLGKVASSVQVHAHGIGEGVLHVGEAVGLVSVGGSELEFQDSCLHRQIMTQGGVCVSNLLALSRHGAFQGHSYPPAG